jgi:hypothetical protein
MMTQWVTMLAQEPGEVSLIDLFETLLKKNKTKSQVWWCTPLIPALRRQRQADPREIQSQNHTQHFFK